MKPFSRRNFLLTAAAAAAAPSALRGQRLPQRNILGEAFLSRLPSLMEWANVPGIAIATLRNGRPAWSAGIGLKKAGEASPVTTATLFGAASLSKPVLAYAILRMRDERLIDLDRPLREYLEYEDLPPGEQARSITARHVLSHSTGLQNWRFNRDQKLELAFRPGERFQYSGEGYYYLQRVLERISGRGFEEYMQNRVLRPLGMRTSTFSWTAAAETGMSWGHNLRMVPVEAFNATRGRQMLAAGEAMNKPIANWKHEDVVRAFTDANRDAPALPNSLLPNTAGSLITSVNEYAGFMARLLRPASDGADLSQRSRAEMTAPVVKVNQQISWGLGLGLENYGSRQMFWHWGDNGVFKAFMMGEAASGTGLVVFTNGQNGHRIWQRVLTEAMGPDHPASYFFMT